ncbi:MAG: hypothetical protein ACYTAQ_13955 [Planctomycetota bacterium]|jgi:hypothetical protein
MGKRCLRAQRRRRTVGASLAAVLLAAPGLAGPATDSDGDGMPDDEDNCVLVANAPPADCDWDNDGFGNGCDGDFNNNGVVNLGDFTAIFVPEFTAGTAFLTDMDCGGTVATGDFTTLFVPQFTQGLPGPSGLACAGTVPCP